MMKLLLDTHIWVWSTLEPQRLSANVAKELSDSKNELWLSPLSLLEVFLLTERKRLSLHKGARVWVAEALATQIWTEAPLTHSVALAAHRIELSHRDPVDHLLAATALAYGLTLVTADKRLIEVRGLSTLANR